MTIQKMLDGTADAWEELTSTQSSRTGHTAARVASALANNIAPEVIALQMTINSKKNNPESPVSFTAGDITTINKLFSANQTRSALTKQQTGSLIREQTLADDKPSAGSATTVPVGTVPVP